MCNTFVCKCSSLNVLNWICSKLLEFAISKTFFRIDRNNNRWDFKSLHNFYRHAWVLGPLYYLQSLCWIRVRRNAPWGKNIISIFSITLTWKLNRTILIIGYRYYNQTEESQIKSMKMFSNVKHYAIDYKLIIWIRSVWQRCRLISLVVGILMLT